MRKSAIIFGSMTAALALTAASIGGAWAAPEEAATGLQGECNRVTAGYYRQWRDINTTKESDRRQNVQRMDEIPASVDIVNAFATKPEDDPDFWRAMRDTYIPNLNRQGTEVVFTYWIEDIIGADVGNSEASYEAKARELAKVVDDYGLNGLDFDMERNLSSVEVERAAGVINALGKYIGPRSGTGRLLIYDSNMGGEQAIVPRIAPNISYVFYQAYGGSTARLQRAWQSYSPYISSCQFLPGVSFYEERGARWGDVSTPFERSRAAEYARWNPQGGKKGGAFVYALDRDGKLEGDDTISRTDYAWITQMSRWIDQA